MDEDGNIDGDRVLNVDEVAFVTGMDLGKCLHFWERKKQQEGEDNFLEILLQFVLQQMQVV